MDKQEFKQEIKFNISACRMTSDGQLKTAKFVLMALANELSLGHLSSPSEISDFVWNQIEAIDELQEGE